MKWTEVFDDLIVKDNHLPSWKDVATTLRDKTHDYVAKWIAGDREVMRKAIKDALKDNTLDNKEVIGILAALAQTWENNKVLGSEFVKLLLVDLQDGQLTSREVAEVTAQWAVGRTSNNTLKELIRNAADGHLTRNEIEQAIVNWLERINRAALANRLRQAIDAPSSALGLRSLVLLTAAYLIDTKKISQAGSTPEKQKNDLVSAFNLLADSPLVPIIEALVDDDLPAAVKLLFRELGINADEALSKAVLSGKLHNILQDLLRKSLRHALSDLTEAQATALANTVTRILKGETQLIPKQTEQQELGFDDKAYDRWQRVRRVLYAAKIAVLGGPIVPSEALAQPHVFAAAAIQINTDLGKLLPEAQWNDFCAYTSRFVRIEFERPHMNSPIDADLLRDGTDARFVYRFVRENLRED